MKAPFPSDSATWAEPSCSLCGDVAERFTVRAIDTVTGMAAASAGGCEVAVALDLVEGVSVGDTVLVHQGFAIARLDDAPEHECRSTNDDG